MSRLDDYQTALLAAHSDIPSKALEKALASRGPEFSAFIVAHGLGPLWHERTGLDVFRRSRLQAEALFITQEAALAEIDSVLNAADIDHVVIKGAANRLVFYQTPAIRVCHDLDVCVRGEDKVRAASALVDVGFTAERDTEGISRVLVLSRGHVNVDLHWGLLREGRLRFDPVRDMIERRRRIETIWALDAEDTLFTLLVHPAFAKHLSGWNMGLHRVADLLRANQLLDVDQSVVRAMLEEQGVRTAAWATLRWSKLLAGENAPESIDEMLRELHPGRFRSAWLDYWLRNDLPLRTARTRLARLAGFSAFLHDNLSDTLRAARGRWTARRRNAADLAAFRGLLG